MIPKEPPSPLEWHPAYADRTWLLDWLDERGPFSALDVIALPKVHRVEWTADPYPTASSIPPMMMRRVRCAGPAPYVGRPFVYEWMAGVDDSGRCIANDSTIRYSHTYESKPATI